MDSSRISIDGTDIAFAQDGQDTVLRAALRAGIGFPYECASGGCGSCKFDLVSGAVDNLWPEAPGLTDRDRRKQRLLACQCRARGDLCIKVRPSQESKPLVLPRRRTAKLAGITDITHDIREFRFVTDSAAEFLPGQFALLDIPGIPTPRAYSMSNIANEAGQWHFQIRRVREGKATAALFDRLEPGDVIGLDGPYGLAWLRQDNERDLICIAGGSGLAPMVSIARGASAAGLLDKRKLHFYYGARTAADVCGEHLLGELPEFASKLHFHPVVSMPESSALWSGAIGFVHQQVEQDFGSRLADHEFYFAGPPPMTQSLQEMLMVQYKVPFSQIHYDRFF
ncbi:2Fe-2S iron-sulfur cluster-binding protein [Hydrocarboniphaga effusa]|uniref:2Fe-2S iron-sulfur cluster-binding protein n=1 Tax=Hydrocarboniphaga effusa TaxID=243629 RepID=UPI00398C139D